MLKFKLIFKKKFLKNIQNDYEFERVDEFELEQHKKQRLLEKEFWNICKEITSFTIFLIFLYFVAYSNQSKSSIDFNQLYKNAFITVQGNDEMGLNNVKNSF
jgi:hypothetical protein